MKATCCLWLHKYGPKKDGVETYPVKLRVTFNREVKYYYLGLRLTDSQFSGLFLQKQLRSQYQELSHYLAKAETIIADLREEFEWITFENLFFSRNKERNNNPDIFTSIERYVNQLRKKKAG